MRRGPAPGGTPRTTFSLTFGSVPSGFAGPAPFWAAAFPTAGTFSYHCAIHPGMIGTVVVR